MRPTTRAGRRRYKLARQIRRLEHHVAELAIDYCTTSSAITDLRVAVNALIRVRAELISAILSDDLRI